MPAIILTHSSSLLLFTGLSVTEFHWLITLVSAISAAFLSSIASQPGDTLLSSVNKQARRVISKGQSIGSGSVAITTSATTTEVVLGNKFDSKIVNNLELDEQDESNNIVYLPKIKTCNFQENSSENNSNNRNNDNDNVVQIMRECVQELGLKGLFTGTKARLVHVGVIVVVQLTAYEYVKQLLGIPMSSTH